ncbi:YicC family protein [Prolixibacteraceae bacterium JC049]|nr:YicC family protein [Prolixibacteraceae bacterium JC049]
MIQSMTGFGKAELEINNKKITIEIRSLNSKQLDINTRIPSLYKEKDIEIRKEISEALQRGKVEFNIFIESLGETSNAVINKPIIKSYYEQLNEIGQEIGLNINDGIMQVITRLPDAVKIQFEELDENEWLVIRESVRKALADLVTFRKQEGISLYNDIKANIENIQRLQAEVEPHEEERVARVKERLRDGLKELEMNGNVDNNRFEQELIFYIEKLDINEEKVRLTNHCNYFLETMEQEGSQGKKMGFIAQEIGREINTMGSKANHSELQKIVVQMKDSLERIKEQVLNTL